MRRVFRTNGRHGQGGKDAGLGRAQTPYGAKVAVKATGGSLVRLFAGSEKKA